MSAENVELARRGYAAIARGDYEAVAEMLSPDVKWHGGDVAAGCQNRGEALGFMRAAARRKEVARLVDVIDAEDRVVVVLAPPDESGLRANVSTFRDGLVVEMVAYESAQAACAAAGVALPAGLED